MMTESRELNRASEIAAAMLRFCEEAAYPDRSGPPEGWPRSAEPCYMFRHSNERVLRDDVADYLEALEGPTLLTPTLIALSVVVTRQDDLSGAALEATRARFTAQGESARVLRMKDDDRVLLEFDGESCTFAASTLYEWSRRYSVVSLAWTLSPLKDDSRAGVSMDLLRADGHCSTHFRDTV
jgi:hypothetical protein